MLKWEFFLEDKETTIKLLLILGTKGASGDKGVQGNAGFKGEKGDSIKGNKGSQGRPGNPGLPGKCKCVSECGSEYTDSRYRTRYTGYKK